MPPSAKKALTISPKCKSGKFRHPGLLDARSEDRIVLMAEAEFAEAGTATQVNTMNADK